MKTQPFIVTVILNWNLPQETLACVNALLASDYAHHHIIVVDNGSTDNSVLQIQSELGDQVTLLETSENLFFAGGNNTGIRYALDIGADYVLVLNNDTQVASDMITTLVETARQRPQAGILAPMIYYGHDRARIWALGTQKRWEWPFPYDVGRNEIDHGQYSQPMSVTYVTGCAMLVRRDVFQRIGLLDPAYQMYYEDADFCARAQQAGFEIIAEPRAKVWHLVSASAMRRAATSYYQHTRYRVRFYRQHPHGLWPWITHILLIGQETTRIFQAMVQGNTKLAAAGWCGLRDGYREPIRNAH
jgi:GT2 family glycosyltransferase